MRIYLDACCLNRPFDDLSQDRIYFESDAILTILSRCRLDEWTLVSSEIIDLELLKNPSAEKREKVQTLRDIAKERLILDEKARQRATDFQDVGIKVMDSLHLAVAEGGGVDVFLTTDDVFLRATQKIEKAVITANPVNWLMEVIQNEQ